MAAELYSLSNPVFASFAFYATVVVFKMFALAFLTAVKRFINNAFANPEDGKMTGVKPSISDNVERVRRNHLNDLENIPAFLILGLLYVAIQPNPATALWHFRIFAGARIVHTLVYQLIVPQPARALSFAVGLVVCVSMAVQILLKTQL